MHQYGAALLAVAACAADLLVIALERGGQAGMNHGANVGLVDAHSKRNGRDHYVEFARLKRILDVFANLRLKPCVIRRGAHPSAAHGKLLRQALR